MPRPDRPEPGPTLADARTRPEQALGPLLQSYRDYLLAIAEEELPLVLRPKTGASDVVQETYLQAQRGFDQFRGDSEPELRAWLRRILLNEIGRVERTYQDTDKRDLGREVPLNGQELPAGGPSPSGIISRDEEEALLLQALQRLPPDYQEAIQLRNFEQLGFEEIGRRLGRSAEAARKLWVRAVDQLGVEQEALDGSRQSPRPPGGACEPPGGVA